MALVEVNSETYIQSADVLHVTEDASNNAVITFFDGTTTLTVTGETARAVAAKLMAAGAGTTDRVFGKVVV